MEAKPVRYSDFNLEITALPEAGQYQVRVIGQTPGGEMAPAQADRVAYHPEEFEPFLVRLDRRKLNLEGLIEFGEKLAGLLLPERTRRLFEDSLKALAPDQGLRLRLRITPLELAALPWEYTYLAKTPGRKLPNDFLALQRRISITRYETTGEKLPALQPLTGVEKVRVVVALASPLDQPPLNIEGDQTAIEAAVDAMKEKTDQVETTVLNPATRKGLLDHLRGADIFHFGGHGVFQKADVDEKGEIIKKGEILLEDSSGNSDPFESDQLAALLNGEGGGGVRLVVLGACSSAARDASGTWSGVAPALTRLNIPAVVGMQFAVRDKNAALFLAYLYLRVLGGYTVDEAVYEGRMAIATGGGMAVVSDSGFEDRDWGTAALYLRAEDGFLFPVPQPAAGQKDSPFVEVQRELGTVSGESIGAKVGRMTGGHLSVKEKIDKVGKGGKAIGAEIEKFG